MQFSYEYAGELLTVQLDKQPDGQFLASTSTTQYRVSASILPDGGWLLHIDGERLLVHTASSQEQHYIHISGVQYTLDKSIGQRSRSRSTSGDLTAEMPGQVIDVRAAEGDVVEVGAILLVLEAMKMEIRVTAPYPGTVAELCVAVGDIVERGQKLVEVHKVRQDG